MRTVILVCGVSGSGKSWVCRQLTDKFHYVPHDEHFKDHVRVTAHKAQTENKVVITECPFGERLTREGLEAVGIKVIPVFVVEPVELVKERYRNREGKPLPKAAETRATSIVKRAEEWNAPYGTSGEVLEHLRGLEL